MEFRSLKQVGDKVKDYKVIATWHQQENIEIYLVRNDEFIYHDYVNSKQLDHLLDFYGLKHAPDHQKGWYFWIGTDDPRWIQNLNQNWHIRERLERRERTIAMARSGEQ